MSNHTPATRPNVIWIFGDQHRAQALSCHGDPTVATPNIDRLAAEGVDFTQAVMGCPLCSPCRGSLLTSQYPNNAVAGHEHAIPDGMPTLAAAFNDAGYHTAWFGKWHVDGHHERDGRAGTHFIPRQRRGGFKTWLGYENNNAQWDCYVHGHRDGDEVDMYRLPTFETDALTDLFIDHIDAQAKAAAPFFAALSVQPPHDPYVAPEPWMRRHTPASLTLRPNVPHIPRVENRARRELAGYYAMIENLDHNVGRIRDALAKTGIDRHTHIIFFSDHGDMHGSQGQFRKTAPWEESIRVPCIIGGGTKYEFKSHRQVKAPINHVDLAPTSLGLCGIEVPDTMVGTDYSYQRVRDKQAGDEPDSAFLQLVVPTGHGDSTDRAWRGIVTRDGWKYAVLEHQPWLMFNLNEDPYEQANLAHNSAFAGQRRQLNDRLRQWLNETGDSFALPEV